MSAKDAPLKQPFCSAKLCSNRSFLICLLWALAWSNVASADLVFVSDLRGRVGTYDTETDSGTFLGDLSLVATRSESLLQVIGLAYDPLRRQVILSDDHANGPGNAEIFGMDIDTGVATPLFSAVRGFRGLAVANDKLYGFNTFTRKVEAYSLVDGSDQNLTAAALPNTGSQSEGMGVNPATNQLYATNLITFPDYSVVGVDATGQEGTDVLDFNLGVFFDDFDYYRGDFLMASLDSTVKRVDGSNGSVSTFLTSSQLTAMGVTSRKSGIAVHLTAVPEPASWMLVLLSMGSIVLMRFRSAKALAVSA